ncbi:MAG: hypothetical protein LBD25_07495, partial [Coriobacteriales bacterium]|nr:hypothetical protein [Coriobacteriales bacterium]
MEHSAKAEKRTWPWLVLPHVLFATTVLVTLLVPDRAVEAVRTGLSLAASYGDKGLAGHLSFVGVLLVVEAAALVRRKRLSHADVSSIVFAFLLAWEVATAKLPVAVSLLYPSPEQVLGVFATGWPLIVRGLQSSGLILGT